MKKILLCCSAGMSTSLLMKQMLDWYDDRDIDVRIKAMGIAEIKPEINNYDVILLAPQMHYALAELKAMTDKQIIPIPAEHYASGDASFVAELALK